MFSKLWFPRFTIWKLHVTRQALGDPPSLVHHSRAAVAECPQDEAAQQCAFCVIHKRKQTLITQSQISDGKHCETNVDCPNKLNQQ